MGRCLRFFEGMGVRVERVMSDNGPGYRSGEFNALLESEGARHVYTRAYSPWRNGKVERMNRTLAQEWQYARAWDGEAGRASALPAFIEHYNWERPHSACGGPAAHVAHRRRKQPIGTQQLEKLGVQDGGRLIDKTIIVDFLMANFDRHTHNFGLIRDA